MLACARNTSDCSYFSTWRPAPASLAAAPAMKASASVHPPRRRQARGQRRIDLLLDVAALVFAEVGFEAATTNVIAARAGISPGSLYRFFPNKDAIAEALADRFAQ